MSSLILSLLTELGIRTRPSRPPRCPQDSEPESPQSQTKPPTGDRPDPIVSESGQDSGDLESTSGNAGSLPAPPFFTVLPKDMDGRTSEPEGVRIMPQNGSLSGDTTATNRHTSNIVRTAGVGIDTRSPENPGSGHTESPGPPGNNSQLRSEGAGRPPNNALNIDEASHMSLPADDGMGWLRNKIHAIRELDLGNDEKARMVHDLMTASYNSSRILSPSLSAAMSPTLDPSRLAQPGSPPTLGRKHSPNLAPLSPTVAASISQYENQFMLTPEDLQPTYVPKVEPELVAETGEETGEEDPDTEELEETSLGCQHYRRNVKLQCFTCKMWYTCRFCHDEVEDHHLIRRDTENMLCMLCGHPQPAAHDCRKCGVQTAQYYCEICKLWDNDGKKSIYHCNDCGICRIGLGLGKDFFHCKTCSVCLPISIEDTHRCIERSTQCDCPICGEYMFTSPETVVVMRCGHSLHHRCLSEYSKTSFRCPICSKTITNMESTFRNLDRTIESQPMPEEFTDTKGLIYCNDCGAKSVVKYHWLGLKCDLCESYNTAQMRVLHGDVSAVLEEEGVSDLSSRPRSSSLNVNGEPTASLASLHLSASQATQSQLSVPVAAGSDRQFVSYNMTHGRAISPVVSNYFGLPTERESEKPSSLPFFGGTSQDNKTGDYGALNFLSKKFRGRYGFLAGETALTEGASEAEEEDDDAGSSDSSESEEDGEEEDEGAEHIDIFGHR
ncbi:uncharacterized protein N7498_004339 [Penicillium cinerascens]|uniref:RING-type domain-containing protein n=1 Tax=Penicillium cinerascens TaxID=70096 RepID=A0A9W9N4V1_9EURO|nr:uncharacterized protein N7498_004339 [Penicillium cinerascens]KAJ5212693.1 hypothetical protein N7498_004339 [Penicillium cinerascens]